MRSPKRSEPIAEHVNRSESVSCPCFCDASLITRTAEWEVTMSRELREAVEIVCPQLIAAPDIWNEMASAIYASPISADAPLAVDVAVACGGGLPGIRSPDAVRAVSETLMPVLFMAADSARAVGVLARDGSTVHASIACTRAIVESAGKVIWALDETAPAEAHAMRSHVLMRGDDKPRRSEQATAHAEHIRSRTSVWFDDAALPKYPGLGTCAGEVERRLKASGRLYGALSTVAHADASWFYAQVRPEGLTLPDEELVARLWLSFAAFGDAAKHVASYHGIDAVIQRIDASLDVVEPACQAVLEAS